MNEPLSARGLVCGEKLMNVSQVAKALRSKDPQEVEQALKISAKLDFYNKWVATALRNLRKSSVYGDRAAQVLAKISRKTESELVGRRVFVFYNWPSGIWSLWEPNKNRLIYHTNEILLKDAVFRVRDSIRREVVASGTKKVHAGVVGTVVAFRAKRPKEASAVTYNPFKYKTFVRLPSLKPVKASQKVAMVMDHEEIVARDGKTKMKAKPRVYAVRPE